MSAPPPGIVLAIDTSSPLVSLSIERDGEPVAERSWQLEGTASRELLAGIDSLLRDQQLPRRQLAALAVCVGPGGYGGLRTGISTAQGLAFALGIPLAPVTRLLADAWPDLAEASGHPVVAVHHAGRAGVAWASYARPAGERGAHTLVAPQITQIAHCVRDAPSGAIWCGELTEQLLAERSGAGRPGDRAGRFPRSIRAATMLAVARSEQSYRDPAAVDAIYLRPPAITPPTADSPFNRSPREASATGGQN